MQPAAHTILHKSSTPLVLWFYAIYLMSVTRAGISAKQLQRELGVTYKCAWRMFHQIRSMMGDDPDKNLFGEVEVDETYFHADPSKNSRVNRKMPDRRYYDSEVVFGMVERGGRAKVRHVKSSGKRIIVPELVKGIATTSTVYSDEARIYGKLAVWGYNHYSVVHSKNQYVVGRMHTQNVENLWSNIKRGIKGVYRHVDPKYLQAYANEYAFRYSHRNHPAMFWALACRIAKRPASGSPS